MATAKIEALDGSGNYIIQILDSKGRTIEIQEFSREGKLLQRVYGEQAAP